MAHTPSLAQFDTLLHLMSAIPDEQSAIDHYTALRWEGGAFCPLCGSARVYHFFDKRTHKCGDCRKRFSIKVGTIFEGSNIGMRPWLMAIWLITSHKKGIASTQLARDIGVTQKTAWFMLHRLRHAARDQAFQGPLDGEVEVDETFVGKHVERGHRGGNPAEGKAIVLGMMQRGGDVVTKVIPDRKRDTIFPLIQDAVTVGAEIHTDEYRTYDAVSSMGYSHKSVNHRAGEHVSKEGGSINSLEGFWGQFKRQVVGIHHFISQKHVGRYVAEATWRFNLRAMGEGERVNQLLIDSGGKRLRYKELIA